FHDWPPSVVLNVRPSEVVTDAILSSAARTDSRSTASGNAMRRHERASVVSRTIPCGPTSQQIDGDGDAPPDSITAAPVGCNSHVDPRSVECSTAPLATMRQTLLGFDETINAVDGRASNMAAGARITAADPAIERCKATEGAAGGAADSAAERSGAGTGAGGRAVVT